MALKGSTNGMHVGYKFNVSQRFKSNFFDHRYVLAPFATAVAIKYCENVVVIIKKALYTYIHITRG